MSISAGIDPSDFLDLHYCEECRKIGDFENDLCGECAELWSDDDDPQEFACKHCGKIFEAYKDEGGICSQCIKREDKSEECDDGTEDDEYICCRCGQMFQAYKSDGFCIQCLKRDEQLGDDE